MSSPVTDFIIGAVAIGAGILVAPIPGVGGFLSVSLFSFGSSKIIGGIARLRNRAEQRIEGVKLTVRSTQAALPVVYGKMRVGVKIVDTRVIDSTDPDTPLADPTDFFAGADDNDVLARVGAFCLGSEDGSGIQAVEDIRLYPDGVDVIFTPAAFGAAPSNTGVATRFQDDLKYSLEDGSDAQVPDVTVTNNLGWGANMLGRGIAYGSFFFNFNPEVYSKGVPQITAKITGNRVYDPRSSTWIGFSPTLASSDNPALCILDYLTSRRYGGAVPYSARDGGPFDFIDEQSFIDAANYCDDLVTIPGATTEKRFLLNGVILGGRQVGSNLAELLVTCRGNLVWQNGLYRLVIRQVTTAETLELTEDNIVGEIGWVKKGSDIPNIIEATFPDSLDGDFVANSVVWPLTGDTTFLDEDNGVENRVEVELPYTTGYYQTLRTIMVMLREARNDILATLVCTQEAYTFQVGNVIKVTHEGPGWVQEEFSVLQIGLTVDGLTRLALQKYTSAAYSLDSLNAQPATPTTNLPDPTTIAPPTSFAAVSGTIATALSTQDEDIVPRVLLTWVAPADTFLRSYVVRMKLDSEAVADWRVVGRPAKEDTELFVNGVTDGESYDFDIIAVNKLGIESTPPVEINAHVVGTVDVNRVRILDERPISAGVNVDLEQAWNRSLRLEIGPGTLSVRIVVESFTQNLPIDDPGWPSTTVGPFTQDLDVTAGSTFDHTIEDGSGNPLEFNIKEDEFAILPGGTGGKTITVTPYDATGGGGGAGAAGVAKTTVTKSILTYDDVGFRSDQTLDTRVFSNDLPSTSSGSTLNLNNSTIKHAIDQATTAAPGGIQLSQFGVYLKKTLSPTGNLTATVYVDSGGLPTGAALGTSDPLDVSTLTTSYPTRNGGNHQRLVFDPPIALAASTLYHFAVEYSGGDASNFVSIDCEATGGHSEFIASWAAGSAFRPIFRIYSAQVQERFGRKVLMSTNMVFERDAVTGEHLLRSTAAGGGGGTVTEVTVGTGLDVTAPTTVPNITLSLDELAEKSGALVGTDRLVGLTSLTHWAETISGIPLSIFNNDDGWAPGTVTAVTGGQGIDSTGGTTPNLTFDASELSLGGVLLGSDHLVAANGGVSNRQVISSIPLSIFDNDLTGFVTDVTAGSLGIDSSGGDTPAISLDLAELAEKSGALVGGDRMVVVSGAAQHAETINTIPLGIFSNDQGWQPGTVTAVTGGTGIDSTGGTTPDLSFDASELSLGGVLLGSDHLVAANGGVSNRQLISSIPLSIFDNDAGFSAGAVTDVTAGVGLDSSGGTTPNITLDLDELTTSVTDGHGDFFVVVDAVGVQRKLTKANILLGGFSNDQAWAAGTVTSVAVAGGIGLTSSGGPITSTGTITLAVDFTELPVSGLLAGVDDLVTIDGSVSSKSQIDTIPLNAFLDNVDRVVEVELFGSAAMSTGNQKAIFHIPALLDGWNLALVHMETWTAGVSGGVATVQIRNATQAADMLSTPLTIDVNETGSDTAATPPVVDGANDDVAENDVIQFDVDTVHTTPATGCLVTMVFKKP